MKSKTLIKKQLRRKKNPELVDTIFLCKKRELVELAGILSAPTRKRVSLNLEEIDQKVDKEKIVIIPGKVLGQGELKKKIKIIALNFSESAKEKLIKDKIDFITIKEEIEKNKKLEGKILI